MPQNVAEPLAPLTALDETGRPVTLGTLWTDRATALVFVRQFG